MKSSHPEVRPLQAGLLGRKLGHSLSPLVHRFFGCSSYVFCEREPEEVADFLRGTFAADGLDFLNVTIPYKRIVLDLCDALSPVAKAVGSVNFVRRADDGSLWGDNTDVFGFGRLLDSVGADVRGRNCAVLGAGGAALAVRYVLEERGARRVRLLGRGENPAADDGVIVNATPVGTVPDVDGMRVDPGDYPACDVFLDLVYNPSPTRFVREARARGKIAADGLVMLVAQAYRAWQLTGRAEEGGTLFLYGPPASGKTTWAKCLSAATGRIRIDLDAEIEKSAGRTVAEIFAAEGEAGFRAREKSALQAVCAAADPSSGRIIALGGGTLLDAESRHLAEATGRIVVLPYDVATLASRLTGGDRPLSPTVARLESLLAERASHYASF